MIIVYILIGIVIGWFVHRLVVLSLQKNRMLFCAFCEEEQVSYSEEDHIRKVREHVLKCDKHPMGIEIRQLQSKLDEIKRLIDAKPDTLESYQYILGEISDIVNGDRNDAPTS